MKTVDDILDMNFLVFREVYKHAAKIHEGQYRKDKVTPYMRHIDAVIENTYEWVVNNNDDFSKEMEIYLCVAAYHDAYEDHPDKITLGDIFIRVRTAWWNVYGESAYDGQASRVKRAVDAISKKRKGSGDI